MNRTAFKFAASTVIVAMTMAGFSAPSTAMRRLGNTVQANGRTDRQAAQLHEQAARALREGRLAEALEPDGAGGRALARATSATGCCSATSI